MSSPLKRTSARRQLVAGTAHEHVRQRRLARAVRAHQRVGLALLHGEVDPLQDLLALDGRLELLDLQRGGVRSSQLSSGTSIITSSSSTLIANTSTGLRGRQRPRRARVEVERGAVLGALDRLVLDVDLALGQEVVRVRADRRPTTRNPSSPRFATANGRWSSSNRRTSPSGTSPTPQIRTRHRATSSSARIGQRPNPRAISCSIACSRPSRTSAMSTRSSTSGRSRTRSAARPPSPGCRGSQVEELVLGDRPDARGVAAARGVVGEDLQVRHRLRLRAWSDSRMFRLVW